MKKLIVLLLTFSFVIGAFAFAASAEGVEFFCDVNGDGLTDNLDSALILKYDAGLTDTAEGGDANGDGDVDNLDAAMVLKYDAGLEQGEALIPFDGVTVSGIPRQYFDSERWCPTKSTVVVRSLDEYNAFWGDMDLEGDYYVDTPLETIKLIERIDGAFFESKMLIIGLYGSHSSSEDFKADHVIKDADGLTVAVERVSPECQDTDMVFSTVMVAVEKKYDVPDDKIKTKELYTTEYFVCDSRYSFGVESRFTPSTDGNAPTAPEIHFIKSDEEYDAYMEGAKYDFNASLPGVDSYNAAHGGGWYKGTFDHRYIMVIVTPENPAKVRYHVDGRYNVDKNVPSFNVSLNRLEVDSMPDTEGCWHIFISLEKYMFGGIDPETVLNFSFEEITDCE